MQVTPQMMRIELIRITQAVTNLYAMLDAIEQGVPPEEPTIPPLPPDTQLVRNNQADGYGVKIDEWDPAEQRPVRIAKMVRHLSPAENAGKRNVYIDVVDQNGQRDRNPKLKVEWTWEGRKPWEAAPPVALDKPASEPMANIPLNAGQKLRVWITGDGIPCDEVYNISSDHPDEGNGNTRFHHSFHVTFKKVP